MSTDLQLPQDLLPSITLTSLKIKLPVSPTPPDSTSNESQAVQLEEEEAEYCQTPTSSEHKIPDITSCPPAPKKQRLSAPSCKRKISEFELFEFVERDEIEEFFKSSYEFINQNSITNKRRCGPL